MVASPATPAGLRKDVGLVGVVTFGAGTAIGVSIFTVLQPTAQIAGSGLLAAIAVSALPMVLFAIAYAYLGSVAPVSGASYAWPSRFLHPMVGFLIAWLRIIANVGVLTILAQILVSYLGMLVKLPQKLSVMVLLTVVFGLNLVGVSLASRVQSIMMGVLLAVLAIFVATGAPVLDLKMIGSPLSHGPIAVLAAVPLMISLFLGIESAVEIGEEVRDAQRTIPLGIALAIGLTAVVYGLVAFTALGLVGPEKLAASKTPLLDAAKVSLGGLATPLIIGAATVSIFKSMNAAALVFSRSLFAMGRSGALPSVFGKVHPRFGTPHMAVLLAYGCALTGLLLPSSLIFLLLAVNIPTMLKYLACSLAATRVAARHPDLHAASRLGISREAVMGVGYAGALAALVITVFGIEADTRPYLLIGGWLVVGMIYWAVRGRHARPDPSH